MESKQPDFSKIIRDLGRQGMTTRQIARKVGVSSTSVDRIKNHGIEPRYSVGSSLVILSMQ